MAEHPDKIFEHDAEIEQIDPRFATVRHRRYGVGDGKTLADVTLQRGNTLPTTPDETDGGDFEIIEAAMVHDKKGASVAKVVAVKYDTE